MKLITPDLTDCTGKGEVLMKYTGRNIVNMNNINLHLGVTDSNRNVLPVSTMWFIFRPMFIVMDNDPTFEASFIVSTISENLSQTSSASGSVASTSTAHNHTQHQTHNTSVSSPATNQSHHTRPQASHSRKYIGRLDNSHQQSHVPTAKQGTRR